MRYAAKVDTNQKEIASNLVKVGLSVVFLHRIGEGVPDLLVSDSSDMWLLEVKNPDEYWKLTKAQEKWHQAWRGKPPIIGETFDEIYGKIKTKRVVI